MTDLNLAQYSDTPLFNTKAVVRETGVSAATLRAWERRYGVLDPDRTDNNYRLYSEREIMLIRWLRDRVEGGVSISQAVELYRRMEGGKTRLTELPGQTRSSQPPGPHDWGSSQARLIEAFKRFDEQKADQTLNELFALYSIEDVLVHVIQPTMIEIGDQWHRGEVSVPVEHFTSAYVERKLMSIMNAQPVRSDSPLIVTGCAPHEQHEIGVLLFSLFLRRRGRRVVYLGQNVPVIDLRSALEAMQPAMLALSASSQESAEALIEISALVASLPEPRPLLAFGGAAFQNFPELRERLDGIYLGASALEAALTIGQHLPR